MLERLFLNLTISYELINSNRILIGADDENEGFLNFIKRSNRKKLRKFIGKYEIADAFRALQFHTSVLLTMQ